MNNLSGGQWFQGSVASSDVTWFPTIQTTSGTNVLYAQGAYVQQPRPLPSVMASIEAPLSDREWLDAQVAEVCELAAA